MIWYNLMGWIPLWTNVNERNVSKEFLEGLSEVQLQAVVNYNGPTLVIAGDVS